MAADLKNRKCLIAVCVCVTRLDGAEICGALVCGMAILSIRQAILNAIFDKPRRHRMFGVGGARYD